MPATLVPTDKWVLQQQGPAEPAYILSEDNRILACFEEAWDCERSAMLTAPQMLAMLEMVLPLLNGEELIETWHVEAVRNVIADAKGQ